MKADGDTGLIDLRAVPTLPLFLLWRSGRLGLGSRGQIVIKHVAVAQHARILLLLEFREQLVTQRGRLGGERRIRREVIDAVWVSGNIEQLLGRAFAECVLPVYV